VIVKDIVIEDFVNYRLPSMFIISSKCDWKCCREQGLDISICQNADLALSKPRDVSDDTILNMYRSNDITKAVVIGGLEPLLQADEVLELVRTFRKHGEMCDFVIYTGYYPEEITESFMTALQEFGNIIIKFGRYIPNIKPIFDDVLGVQLASENQFARKIS